LREAGKLKPWGAIVYARKMEKWGIAWSQESRQAAVASARASCGAQAQCALEISFFGTECGAFAHADASFAIVARKSMQQARDSALSDCGKRGRSCRIDGTITHPTSKGTWSCTAGEYIHVWDSFGVRGPYTLSPDGKRLIKIKDGSVSFSRN